MRYHEARASAYEGQAYLLVSKPHNATLLTDLSILCPLSLSGNYYQLA